MVKVDPQQQPLIIACIQRSNAVQNIRVKDTKLLLARLLCPILHMCILVIVMIRVADYCFGSVGVCATKFIIYMAAFA